MSSLLKPGMDQNIAMQASPTAGNVFYVLTGPINFIFCKTSLYFLIALIVANAVSRVGPRNRIGHSIATTD